MQASDRIERCANAVLVRRTKHEAGMAAPASWPLCSPTGKAAASCGADQHSPGLDAGLHILTMNNAS